MIVNFDALSANRVYHTMIQTLIPRPVAWVLSDSGADLDYNLAPFSYFTAVSSQPPLLMFSVGKKPDGTLKDTRVNIRQRKHFVVHIASSNMADEMTKSSASLAFGESELAGSGLTVTDFEGFSLPRLDCCDVAYACELFEYKEIGDVPQALIFGLIKQVYIDDRVIAVGEGGRFSVDAQKLDPIARLGGDNYWVQGQSISVTRPK